MFIQAVVAYVGLTPLEELCKDFALPDIKIVVDVLLIPLHLDRAPQKAVVNELCVFDTRQVPVLGCCSEHGYAMLTCFFQ